MPRSDLEWLHLMAESAEQSARANMDRGTLHIDWIGKARRCLPSPDHAALVARFREVQELYDATTVLLAALTFTHRAEDLLRPEFNQAVERLIHARFYARRVGAVEHVEALIVQRREADALSREDQG